MANKLDQWLKATGTKRNAFAEAISVSPAYVTLLCSDAPAWPGREVAERIREATKGEVTPNDFLSDEAGPPRPISGGAGDEGEASKQTEAAA